MKRALYFIIAVLMLGIPAARLPQKTELEKVSYEVRR